MSFPGAFPGVNKFQVFPGISWFSRKSGYPATCPEALGWAPALYLKKPLCTDNLSHSRKIFIERPETPFACPICKHPNSKYNYKLFKVTLLSGIVFDNILKFYKHIENIFLKANSKFNALARLANYMELPKRHILINAFSKAQFNNCPAVSMFHSCSLNNKIN